MQLSPAVAADAGPTAGHVAVSGLAAIGFGVFVRLFITFGARPFWSNWGKASDLVIQWGLPALFVVGGVVAEIVAGVMALS